MWPLWKMTFRKCEFCEKWALESVNFVKKWDLKMWILWKMRFWKCDFCEKWNFENMNFVKKRDFHIRNLVKNPKNQWYICVYFSDVTTQTRQLSTDPKQSLVKGDFHCSTQFSVLDSVHKTVQLANLRQFSHKSMYKSSDNIPGFLLQKCHIFVGNKSGQIIRKPCLLLRRTQLS